MIFSDHFVLFYNELFKALDQAGGNSLQEYWLEIAGVQDGLLGPYIDAEGFDGMKTYWDTIISEENCKADTGVTADYFELKMHECPSLSKNLKNEAGAFSRYCDHCAGWIGPVVRKHGFHLAYDMISRKEPRCTFRVYADPDAAEGWRQQMSLPAEEETT